MRILYTFLIICLIGFTGYGQKYKSLDYVKINEGYNLTKVVTVKSCPEQITKGDSIKSVTTYKDTSKGEKTYTISSHKIAGSNEEISIDKKISLNLKSFEGKANLFLDENDKSKIHINYWLNDKNFIPKETKIIIRNKKLQCNETYKKEVKTVITKIDSTYNLWRVDTKDITFKNDNGKEEIIEPDYFNYCNIIIEVYETDNNTKPDYYLVNKYDKNADYILKLENRDVISFGERAWEFGAVTIPIKFRPLQRGNNTKVGQKFVGDLNVGAFATYKLGTYKARYVRGAGFEKLASISCNIGPFFTIGTENLDKNNTTTGKIPITNDSTQSIGTVTPGAGIMLNIYNFQLGIYTGWDIGVGSKSSNWDYHGKQWFGFGFSYSLKTPWKE
ncbi:hypothetical protein [Neptunitalea lumnitzerae]|uniref:Uncharacterized protein n=1 Tax=Neptunitalea lumnitzerae TaxID=2965509 RepID=A0ABQ5MGW4_9FLAO|nr:hypothetical protein [Neptunitalea sp. Y10]GLB48644.1 hypothetical protein Y10_10120 [Neptunitalea sp. Y10]